MSSPPHQVCQQEVGAREDAVLLGILRAKFSEQCGSGKFVSILVESFFPLWSELQGQRRYRRTCELWIEAEDDVTVRHSIFEIRLR